MNEAATAECTAAEKDRHHEGPAALKDCDLDGFVQLSSESIRYFGFSDMLSLLIRRARPGKVNP